MLLPMDQNTVNIKICTHTPHEHRLLNKAILILAQSSINYHWDTGKKYAWANTVNGEPIVTQYYVYSKLSSV